MLGQMATQRVDQLRALAHQKITGAEQHGASLLFLGFDRDKAHGRPARRLGRSPRHLPRRSFGA